MRFTKEDLRNQANGVGDVPQEEAEGSASETEMNEANELSASHVVDPNSAMADRPTEATEMLKALNG